MLLLAVVLLFENTFNVSPHVVEAQYSSATSGETQQERIALTAAPYPISITDIKAGEDGVGHFTISTAFNNRGSDSLSFTGLVEVRDSDGVTISLQFVKGTIYVGQSREIATSWSPPKSGSYDIRSFAVSSFESPQILSPVMSKLITINESSSAPEPVPSSNIIPARTHNESSLCTGSAQCFDGTVTKIVDGDTLDVGDIRIRLSIVDTPETYEEGYAEAKSFTSKLCPVGSDVIVDQDDRQLQDRYGRTLAKVTCGDNKVLNAELLHKGYAEILKEYCAKSEFFAEDWAQQYGCAVSANATTDGTQCDPSYPEVCIPSPPPDLDCSQISYKSFKVLPPDPHRFDTDKDGIGCES